MFRHFFLICLSGLLVLLFPLQSLSDLDANSIFRDARKTASILDVELAIIQRTWWTTYVLNPDDTVKSQFPNITGAGMGIELKYSNNDTILAKGIITNLQGFLKLTEIQKKLLIKNTLRNLRNHLLFLGYLVDKNSGKETGELIGNRHIVLNVIFDDVTENTKNESINLILPRNIGNGQAGYADGYFIFSRPYYLDIKVENFKAEPGDKYIFEIETEEKK